MADCDDRQLAEAQRVAGYQNQRTGVPQALRPFTGRPTLDNLLDYINRELVPAVRRTRSAVNDIYLPAVENAPSANPLIYYFSTDTTNADPTTGRLRLDASPQNTATTIRISETNARLVDALPWLEVMAGGSTSPLGVVTLSDAINPGRFLRFDLNSMTDQGAYWDLGVGVIESSHDDPFADGGGLVVSFIPGVASGGTTVPPGSLTPIGANTVIGNPTTSTAAPTEIAIAENSVLGRAGITGTGNIEAITVPGTGTLTGETVFLQSSSLRNHVRWHNWNLSAMPLMLDNRFVGNLSGATARPQYLGFDELNSNTITYENVGKSFIREALTGDVTAPQNSNETTITNGVVTNAKLADMAAGRVKGVQIDGSTGPPQDLTGAEVGELLRFGTVQNVTLSATTNDQTLNADATVLRLASTTGPQTLTGLTGGVAGRLVSIENVSASGNPITLASLSASSSTANRFRTPGGADFAIGFRESAFLRWDSTNGDWRVIGGSRAATLPWAPIYDVMQPPFNAAGNGTADDTAAINAAIAAANANPGIIALGESHRVTAALDAVTANNVWIIGRGEYDGGTKVTLDAEEGVDLFTLNGQYNGIAAVWITNANVYTTGWGVAIFGGYNVRLHRVRIQEFAGGVEIRNSTLTYLDQVEVGTLYGPVGIAATANEGSVSHESIFHRCTVAMGYADTIVGTPVAWAAGEAKAVGNLVIANGNVYQCITAGTTAGSGSGPSGIPGATPSTARTTPIADGTVEWVFAQPAFTGFLHGSRAQTFQLNNCTVLQGAYGLSVEDDDPSSGSLPQFTRAVNLQVDHPLLGGVRLVNGNKARLHHTFITSVMAGSGIEIASTYGGDWEFVGGEVFGCSQAGVLIAKGDGVLSALQIGGSGGGASNTRDCIEVSSSAARWSVVGCSAGVMGTSATSTRYGISIASGCDHYLVENNRFRGNLTGAILNTPGQAETRMVRNNTPEEACTYSAAQTFAHQILVASTQGVTLNATADDFALDDDTNVLRVTPNGSQTLTGLTGGVHGRLLSVENVAGTGNNLTLASLSASSSTANRIRTPNGVDLVLGFRESALLRWDTSNGDWRVISAARGTAVSDADYGDITVSSAGSVWTIDNDVVGDAKLRNSAACSVIGRSANSTGDPADISAAANDRLLARTSDSVAFQQLTVGMVPDGILTNAKLANMTAGTVKGRQIDATTGAPVDLTGAEVGELLRLSTPQDVSISATTNDQTLNADAVLLRVTPSGAQTLTGLTGGASGRVVIIDNVAGTGNPLTLASLDSGSSASNRFRTPGGVALVIGFRESAVLRWNSATSDWRVIAYSAQNAVADGDKGDITVSSSGATWTIDNDVVTDGKLRNSAALSVIGRSANSTGDPADIAAGTDGHVLRRSGTTLGFGTIATAGIADDAVTDAKLRDSAALSVIGRSANSTGNPADIAASADGQVLRRSGTTLGFGTIATAGITDAAVTLAKMAGLAQSRIIGRAESAGTGVPTALTPTQVVSIIDGENATWTGAHSFTGASHTVNVSGTISETSGSTANYTAGTELILSAGTRVSANSPFSVASSLSVGTVSSSSATALDNFSVGSAGVARFTGPPDPLTGIVPAASGQVLLLVNAHASSNMVINLESANSSAANRFAGTGTSRVIRPREMALAWYDDAASRWRLLCRDEIDL